MAYFVKLINVEDWIKIPPKLTGMDLVAETLDTSITTRNVLENTQVRS